MLRRPGASWKEGWKLRRPWRISWRCAPAAWAAAAAASAFWTFARARPSKVAGTRWTQAIWVLRRPSRSTIISPPPGCVSNYNPLPPARHPAIDERIVVAHREQDDRAAAMGPHLGHQLVVRVEDGGAAAGNGLDDDALEGGQLTQRIDLFEAEVIAGNVQHDGDVVGAVAEALAEDPAAGHLEDGEVDPGLR